MAKTNNTVIIIFSIVMFLLLILLLVLTYNSKCKMDNSAKFTSLRTDAQQAEDQRRLYGEASNKRNEYQAVYDPSRAPSSLPDSFTAFADPLAPLSNRANDGINGSDPYGNSTFANSQGTTQFANTVFKNPSDNPNTNLFLDTQIAGSCQGRDRLTSADLLPLDANSKWADLNPQCSGDLQDQNYLTAAYHIGINTVGQSMRNASLDIRKEIPNPQVPVSPWGISTIEPNVTQRGLDVA